MQPNTWEKENDGNMKKGNKVIRLVSYFDAMNR